MLDGDIQILDDLLLGSDHIDQLIIDLVGIQVMYPHPMNAVDTAQLTQQFRQKPLMLREIRSVAAGILGDNDQFLDTGCCQKPGLVKHIIHGPAAELATQRRDHAVGTAVIATFSDLDVGKIFRCGHHTAGLQFRLVNRIKHRHFHIVGEHSFEYRHDAVIAAGAQNAVNLRHLLQDLMLIPLGKAACDQDLADLAGFLQLGSLQDIVDGLSLSRVNKSAGVDHHRVAAHRIHGHFVARFLHTVHHSFTIHLVLGAAQGDKTNSCHIIPPGNRQHPPSSVTGRGAHRRSYGPDAAKRRQPS